MYDFVTNFIQILFCIQHGVELVVTLITYFLLFHFVKKEKEKIVQPNQPAPERWHESTYNYK